MKFRTKIKNAFLFSSMFISNKNLHVTCLEILQALTAVKKEGYLKLNKMRCLIFQKETMDVWTEIYTVRFLRHDLITNTFI